MIVAMDLNALPEEDEETFEGHAGEYPAPEERLESAVDIGWLDCPAFGQEIACSIPSKVPLSEFFNNHVPPGKRYSFKQAIHQQRVLGRKLRLLIDLTNTSRYYPTSDLKKEGIRHVKIQCKGRDSVPDNASVNYFVYEAEKL